MNTAQMIADELERKARLDAEEKLRVFHDAVRRLWSEANSIPGGCGGTPFRADARSAERKLAACVKKFGERFGENHVKELRFRYGMERQKEERDGK